MYKACVFDLDGTTLYTVEALRYSLSKAISIFGYPELTEQETMDYTGHGAGAMVRDSLEISNNDRDPEHFERAMVEYKKVFKENCLRGVKPYDGLPEILRQMQSDGVKLAIISNKPDERTRDNIYGTYGRDFFDVVYGAREGIPLKPDPAGILQVLNELGVGAEETLYFGDSDTDMIAGRAAGCKTVGCLWGYRSREVIESCSPDFILEKVSDMQGIWYN